MTTSQEQEAIEANEMFIAADKMWLLNPFREILESPVQGKWRGFRSKSAALTK